MKLSKSERSRIFKEIDAGNGRRIVTLNNYGVENLTDADYINNVYCIDIEANIIWRIVAPNDVEKNDNFVAFISDSNQMLASCSNGNVYELDPISGVLTYLRHQR